MIRDDINQLLAPPVGLSKAAKKRWQAHTDAVMDLVRSAESTQEGWAILMSSLFQLERKRREYRQQARRRVLRMVERIKRRGGTCVSRVVAAERIYRQEWAEALRRSGKAAQMRDQALAWAKFVRALERIDATPKRKSDAQPAC